MVALVYRAWQKRVSPGCVNAAAEVVARAGTKFTKPGNGRVKHANSRLLEYLSRWMAYLKVRQNPNIKMQWKYFSKKKISKWMTKYRKKYIQVFYCLLLSYCIFWNCVSMTASSKISYPFYSNKCNYRTTASSVGRTYQYWSSMILKVAWLLLPPQILLNQNTLKSVTYD